MSREVQRNECEVEDGTCEVRMDVDYQNRKISVSGVMADQGKMSRARCTPVSLCQSAVMVGPKSQTGNALPEHTNRRLTGY